MNGYTALKWYKQAIHDLMIAEKNISIGGYDVAAFLSEQAVEKLLKALLIFHNQKVPRTHYIDELARMLNLPENSLNNIIDLIPDYTFSRYPDVADQVPYETYTAEIAAEKVSIAKAIFDDLQKMIQPLQDLLHENDRSMDHEV